MIGLVAAAVSGILTVGLTRAALDHLPLDPPNERSSHTRPTRRGGGIGVVPPVLLVWAWLALDAPWAWAAIAGCLVLMAVSWADDHTDLPPGWRFLLHAAVVAVMVGLMPAEARVVHGVPMWFDRALTVLGWLWFVNLFNFMDGIDGISGVETAALGIGIAVVSAFGAVTGLAPFGLAVAGAGLGFLVWNWHPARVFLGDVGSIPLGFLLGFLLLRLAVAGHLAAALILPAYYVADATVTLLRRLLNGEKIWQAHRHHFYQRAVQGGASHARVAVRGAGRRPGADPCRRPGRRRAHRPGGFRGRQRRCSGCWGCFGCGRGNEKSWSPAPAASSEVRSAGR